MKKEVEIKFGWTQENLEEVAWFEMQAEMDKYLLKNIEIRNLMGRLLIEIFDEQEPSVCRVYAGGFVHYSDPIDRETLYLIKGRDTGRTQL